MGVAHTKGCIGRFGAHTKGCRVGAHSIGRKVMSHSKT